MKNLECLNNFPQTYKTFYCVNFQTWCVPKNTNFEIFEVYLRSINVVFASSGYLFSCMKEKNVFRGNLFSGTIKTQFSKDYFFVDDDSDTDFWGESLDLH